MPVLLACAIEDSTDIFGISGGGGLNTPNPPSRYATGSDCPPHPSRAENTGGFELYLRLPSVALWACHEVTFTFTVYLSQSLCCQTSTNNGFQASFSTWLSLTWTNHISCAWMRSDRNLKNKLIYTRGVTATQEEQDEIGV